MAAKRKCSIEGVLFDWDGTLINSYDADASAYLAMFEEMGISWRMEELEKNYSPDWYQVYRAAGLPRRRWADADRAWHAHYAKHQPKLIAGARRVLARLGGAHPLGLVTSGDRDRVTRQLRDRKSTRLNSSHSQISYAVFCLKKKNISSDTEKCAMVMPHIHRMVSLHRHVAFHSFLSPLLMTFIRRISLLMPPPLKYHAATST